MMRLMRPPSMSRTAWVLKSRIVWTALISASTSGCCDSELRPFRALTLGGGRMLRSCDLGRVRERDDGIGQACHVDTLLGLHQAPQFLALIPNIRVHRGDDPVVGEPEREELPLGEVSTHDDLAPLRRVAAVLHAEVELI